MKKGVLILVLLVFCFGTFGQTDEQLVLEADHALYEEDFQLAYDRYQHIHEHYPTENKINYHKEIAYLLSEGRGKVMDKFFSLSETQAKKDKFYHYWIGRIYFSRYEFASAEKHFKEFLSLRVYKSEIIVSETKMFLSWIAKAKVYYENPDRYEIEPVKAINTTYNEISPSFFGQQDELLFMSNRPFENQTEKFFGVFHAHKNSEHNWTDGKYISTFGQFAFDKAKIEVVNADGKAFIYNEEKGGDLYYSHPDGNNWSRPIEYDGKIKKTLLESHFFLSDDHETLLFASNKGGNLDIFWTTFDKNSGNWKDAKNIGGHVNSEFNEDFPYLSHDGKKLYFSSNRPEGLGGYDIYVCEWNGSEWSEPSNLGFPINTTDDEIHFQLNEDNKSGYLSSNRLHSQGGYDIYTFKEIEMIMVTGIIKDDKGYVLGNHEVLFHPVYYDDEIFKTTTNYKGEYTVSLFKNEYFYMEIVLGNLDVHSENFSSEAEPNQTQIIKNFNIKLTDAHPLYVEHDIQFTGASESLNEDLDMLGNKFRVGRSAVLNHIYFDFKSDKINPESEKALESLYQLLIKNKTMVVEVGGHIDAIEAKENASLSLLRAEKIVDQMIKRGVPADRIKAKGYGESKPLASNDDESEGRELNRRIEVKLLETSAAITDYSH